MRAVLIIVVVMLAITSCEMKKNRRNYPTEKQLVLQRKETTPVDFTRLLVMRVVYGVAKVMGLKEPLGEVLNGAFVPPGADDDYDDDDDEDGGIIGGDY